MLPLGACGLQLCYGGLYDSSSSNSGRKRPDFLGISVALI